MKRYDKYKDSGVQWIGQVPEHWEVAPFKRAVTINNGRDYKDVQAEDGYPVIGSGGQFAYATDYLYDGEALLLGRKGTIDRPLYVNEKFWTVDTMFYALPLKGNFCKYLYYLSSTFPFDRYATSTALPSMTQTDLGGHLVALPPLSEQKAIAEWLDERTGRIDRIIATREKQIELLEEMKSAVISRAVTKGLNPDAKMKDSGIEWIGNVPEHWEVAPLKRFLKEPMKYGANESAESDNSEWPRYIRITDIDSTGKLKEETFKSLAPDKAKEYMLNQGDILFARSGATVGKTFLYKMKEPACYAGYLIKGVCGKSVRPDFLLYFTKSLSYENWKNSIFIQATIQNIGADKYSMMYIVVPSLPEQQEIVSYLDRETEKIEKRIGRLRRQIELLKEYKATLISEAVTGKIKVKCEN